ncbi:MAG: hypothetical protein QOH58_2013 [Thermoleophilaceae bacterium]|jgi:hypothetical protein|nr:hypothetical protein [Thermoleophilaceae bacterium]
MSEALERGDVFFFYRPRVGVEQVRGLDDVQRFFLVLKPDRQRCYRRLIVGRKRLPDPNVHEREWAFVAEVAHDPDELRDDVERAEYETKTRGMREQPEGRPVGEGRYSIVDHDGHTHLAYALELPAEPGEAQRLFGISKQASYIVAVRNPTVPAPPGAGLQGDRRAEFPPELLERFGDRRFAPLNPPAFLDHEGAEVVLIGAAETAEEELGVELDAQSERVEDADIFAELRLRPGELPVEPLESGKLR